MKVAACLSDGLTFVYPHLSSSLFFPSVSLFTAVSVWRLRGWCVCVRTLSAMASANVTLENQLHSAQKNLLFLQQDHANTLKGLHAEIRRLQQQCTGEHAYALLFTQLWKSNTFKIFVEQGWQLMFVMILLFHSLNGYLVPKVNMVLWCHY